MINEYEVPAMMPDELPEIKAELKRVTLALSISKSMQCLANYTRQKVNVHDLKMVKKCFSLAENMHAPGNAMVKGTIENVFVFSFSTFMPACSGEERNKLQSIMPLCLHTAYVQQILSSGI